MRQEHFLFRHVQCGMKTFLGLLLLALGPVSHLNAAGLIIVGDDKFWEGSPVIIHPMPPITERRVIVPPRPAPSAPIEVSYTKAEVKIKDQFATTHVEQEFYNPNARRLEGTFLFPVPKGAQLDKFTMNINGKPVEAELLNADKARAIYEDIVRRQRDPALLEYAGQALFKVRIFPIEPHERKKITLSYSQLLKSDAGLVGYALPLNTEKFSAKPLRTVSVKLEVESRRALKSIYSPTHAVGVKRDGAHKATVGFEANDVNPSGDFQVFYTQDDAELGVNLLTYKKDGEDGYFLLLASPGTEQRSTKVMPKDVVFVLDTSGSMQGAKLAKAKKALAFCVENLNDGDRFEVLSFATEVEPLFNNLRDATKENRTAAQQFIEKLKPIGGTAIDDALRKAVALRPDTGARPYVVVFLTDGRPTVGTMDENQILAGATKSKTGLTRIFCFGIGTDVNTHLLDKIAEETKAFSTYVLPEEDIEVKVSSFFTKIKEPVLASPALKFPAGLRVTKVYPAPLPDLFKGEQLIVAGRYTTGGDGAIQIEGQMGGDKKRFAYDVKFARASTEHDFIPRLWATRRVGYLLDEIRLRGESKELRDEVTELARQYAIVTPYTAYLILEDEQRRNVPLHSQTLRRSATTDRLGLSGEAGATRFYRMQMDKAGGAAVAGSRSLNSLKQANTPGEAIASGNYDVYRGESVASFSASPASPAGRARGGASNAVVVSALKAEAQQMQDQGRYAGGKTFFQHGARWVDADVQRQNNAKRARVQFASPEYFDLVKNQPQSKSWLALGANVEFTIGDTVYEVTE
jgi:Ca-activated chloride channel homolog